MEPEKNPEKNEWVSPKTGPTKANRRNGRGLNIARLSVEAENEIGCNFLNDVK